MTDNWVQTEDLGTARVYAISEDRELSFLGEWGYYDLDYICPKGIPVTPELLERIGFERFFVCDTLFYRYWGEGYRLDIDYGEEGNFGPDRLWHVHIDNQDCSTIGNGYFSSLHELQNLVRVITGHDLPITKEMLG